MSFLPAILAKPTRSPKIFSLDNTPIYDQMQDELARKGRLSLTPPPPQHAQVRRNLLAITSGTGDSSDFRS